MAKAQVTKLAMAERIRRNMLNHVDVENKALMVNDNRKALAEERVEIILDYGSDTAALIADLRVELKAFPTGSDELKARKQSWKRSMSKAFSKVHEGLVLEFNGDNPKIKPAEIVVGKSWDEKVREVLEDNGASEQLITATIKTMEKERAVEAKRIAEVRATHAADMKDKKARTVAELRARLAELEKVA